LLYVGKKAEEIFSKMQITTIGDIVRWDRDQLIRKLGKMGGMIHDYANGMDDEPVTSAYSERTLKSVGNGKTFDHDLVGFEEIKCGVILLADEVSGRLRKSGLKCSVVSVTMKTPSFKSTSKQKTLQNPTSLTKEIIDVSMELIHSFWNERTPVRSITITGMKLVSRGEIAEQISMFAEESFDKEKADKIDIVMDSIREKYGSGAIGYVASKTIEKKK
jgi:DNA polymerase-4